MKKLPSKRSGGTTNFIIFLLMLQSVTSPSGVSRSLTPSALGAGVALEGPSPEPARITTGEQDTGESGASIHDHTAAAVEAMAVVEAAAALNALPGEQVVVRRKPGRPPKEKATTTTSTTTTTAPGADQSAEKKNYKWKESADGRDAGLYFDVLNCVYQTRATKEATRTAHAMFESTTSLTMDEKAFSNKAATLRAALRKLAELQTRVDAASHGGATAEASELSELQIAYDQAYQRTLQEFGFSGQGSRRAQARVTAQNYIKVLVAEVTTQERKSAIATAENDRVLAETSRLLEEKNKNIAMIKKNIVAYMLNRFLNRIKQRKSKTDIEHMRKL